MKIIPLNNKILLQEVKEESKSGIIIPEPLNKDKQVQKGVVVATTETKEMNVFLKGTKVLYNDYAAAEIKVDGKTYFLIDAEEILGIYE